MQIFIDFFDFKGLIPHGYCLSWSPFLLWLHVVSDLLITLSYYFIPLILIYFLRQRKDQPYPWLIGMFALFIIACGTTHLLSIATIWIPLYWLDGYIKAFTALISVATALALLKIIPLALKLASPAQLQAEIERAKLAEEAHQEALDRLHKIASRVPGVVYQFRRSADGYFSFPYSSHGIYDLFKVTSREVQDDATAIFNRIHPDDYAHFMASIDESAQKLTPWSYDFRVQFDGSERWLNGSSIPQCNEDGSILWHGFITDITERRENEQQLLILSTAVEKNPASIMITDAETNLLYINHRFTEITGYSSEDVIGKKSRILQSDLNSAEVYQQLWSALKQGDVWQGELINTRKNGECYWEEVHISPVHNAEGVITHYIGIKLDINERKHTEKQLLEAKQQADLANQTKSEFLANMSHEIRTPMNGIIGLTRLVLDTPLSEEQHDYLTKVLTSSRLLLNIINDILDFSKIEAGHLSIEQIQFNLNELLESINSLFHAHAAEKGLVFKIDRDTTIPSYLLGDSLRIQQVLNNLISNAIKFTAHGSVILTIRTLNRNADTIELTFSVQDTGMGMSDDYQKQLFQPFVQADSSITRRFGGTGLGLTISQKLLQLMGSHFQVSSVLDKGSIFSFTLLFTIVNAQQDKINPQPVNEPNLESLLGIHLLVAEDNPVNQMVIKGLLKRLSINVDIANDGYEVIRLLAQNSYDGILMDMHMPNMGGVEATEHIRRQERFSALPIIALSAGVTKEERDKCRQCGMNDFVAKPVDFEELVSTLCRQIGTFQYTENNNNPPYLAPPLLFEEYPSLQQKTLLQIQKDLGNEFPRFLTMFIEHSQRLLAAVHESLANDDLEQAKIALHSFKGMCGTMGGTRLFHLCKEGEKMAGSGELKNQPQLIAQIETELLALNKIIKQTIAA